LRTISLFVLRRAQVIADADEAGRVAQLVSLILLPAELARSGDLVLLRRRAGYPGVKSLRQRETRARPTGW
jgi:hypothetical protein